jgi:alkylation response protein AidB-like acyl-CoA dehydrogenase
VANEADELRDALFASVTDVLGRECPIDAVQRYAAGEPGLEARLRQQAASLGWSGVAAPESSGGSAMGGAALAALYEAIGEHLSPLPLLGQQMAIRALDAAGLADDQRMCRLVAGEVWVAIPPSAQPTPIHLERGEISLAGTTWLLGDANMPWILLPAIDQSGARLVVLAERAPAEPIDVHDRTRAIARLGPGGMRVSNSEIIAMGVRAEPIIDDLIDHAALALAADAIGGARAVLGLTISYLGTRQQFGRPIGSFQALKHRVATMKVRLEAARALVGAAVACRANQGAEASAFASMAKARACDAFLAIAAEAIQLHGGIGFTREHPAHLYLKRAKLSQLLFGDSAWHLDRAAQRVLEAA